MQCGPLPSRTIFVLGWALSSFVGTPDKIGVMLAVVVVCITLVYKRTLFFDKK